MSKKYECHNCHLQVEPNDKVCRFCGADLTKDKEAIVVKKEEVETKEKTKWPLHMFVYLGVLGASLLMFILMLIPALKADGVSYNCYSVIFGSNLQIGANVPTIIFIFSIVASLNIVAIIRSIMKKSAEIGLFSYFTMFFFLVIAVMSFFAAPLCSRGPNVPTYTIQAGMIIIGIFAILLAVATGFATYLYKKFLVSSPLERAKVE